MDRVDQRLHYFDSRESVDRHHHVLPHWEQGGGTYFVTFRLDDSLPQARLAQWKCERETWITTHPRPWTTEQEQDYHKRFSSKVEQWLDQGHGSCLLRTPELGKIVSEALRFFDGQRWIAHSAVVMPNHAHVLFTPINGHALADILHSWKSFTALQINQRLARQGEIWQRTYFDRLIRDGNHFRNCVRYIRKNPEKARLKDGEFVYFESDWVRSLEI